jgi:hypothetical protein
MPWRQTAIGRDLETIGLRWHGGALLPWEVHKREDQKAVARVKAIGVLDRELEVIRGERLAALRRS